MPRLMPAAALALIIGDRLRAGGAAAADQTCRDIERARAQIGRHRDLMRLALGLRHRLVFSDFDNQHSLISSRRLRSARPREYVSRYPAQNTCHRLSVDGLGDA